jgi:hypothetical protein
MALAFSQQLDEVLQNEDLVYLFAQFLQQTYCLENLAAWIEIEEYKRIPLNSQDSVMKV